MEATVCGEAVLAAEDGLVTESGTPEMWNDGLGEYIELTGLFGKKTRYSRLEKTLFKKGDYVKKGMALGYAGRSGDANNMPFCVVGKNAD